MVTRADSCKYSHLTSSSLASQRTNVLVTFASLVSQQFNILMTLASLAIVVSTLLTKVHTSMLDKICYFMHNKHILYA